MYEIEPIPKDLLEKRKQKIQYLAQNPIDAHLFGERILILDPDKGFQLYDLLFFGKPFSIRKPKPIKYKIFYELSYFESIYLAKRGVIRILQKNEIIDLDKLWIRATSLINDFQSKYIIYEDLREKGFIVKSGLKYGADFVVYIYGPGIDHSPFVVSVFSKNNMLLGLDFLKSGRLSWSVRKRWVLACIFDNAIRYFIFEWNKELSL